MRGESPARNERKPMGLKVCVFMLCMLTIASLALAASAFDGKWTGEIQGATGPQTVMLTLKSQGAKVTGTIATGSAGEIQIQEGTIEGNTRSILKFKTRQMGSGGETIVNWIGTLKWGNTKTSDEIAFTRESAEQAGPVQFNVKRVP